jgi:hypothetical protein
VFAGLILLAGCSHLRAKPVPVACDAMCYVPCTGARGDTGVRWQTAAPPSAADWDVLAGEVVPALADKLRTCELRRQACTTCLRDLQRAGIITPTP